MCGINGFIQFHENYSREGMEKIVHQMNNKIIHRGPNHEGLYSDDLCSLGMRRLSIIDLTGGCQPIWNESNDMMIVFNGELYNYRDLREHLVSHGHVFSTSSDTEVVLHGFEEYGTSFLKQMEGMYAFCIYNTKEKKWFLGRDRIGEKPLYYYLNQKFMLFGSELKSLIATELVPMVIDKDALSTYFQLTYIPAPYTILQGVYKLLPASVMTIDNAGNTITEQYWNLDDSVEQITDYDECKKKLREALFKSVEQRMVSDVPLGAFLSGGFDSSIIVGIMSHISDEPINTFTIGYHEKEYDESDLAGLVAKRNNTNHHVLTMDWNTVLEDLDLLLGNIDEPFADSSLIATYAVSKMTKQHVTVALTGDAGDELFAGYNKYLISYYGEKYNKLPKLIRKSVVEPLVERMPAKSSMVRKAKKVINTVGMDSFHQRKQLMSLGLKPAELELVMKDSYVNPMTFIKEQYEEMSRYDDQTRAQYVDLKTVLEGDMLQKVDRASMLASLETRVPMLDTNVIELAYRMPTKYKINKTERKIILKDTFHDLLPKELFHAPKHGFSVPIGEWLETVLKEKLLCYADAEFLEEQGLFSYEEVHKLIKSHFAHRENRYSELWAFFVFQNWYVRYFKRY
jgi:asparagine synthase (glutamine-hydrolysing)